MVRMTWRAAARRHPPRRKKEDGSPSFKLEYLSKANGLRLRGRAHDALSDVRATLRWRGSFASTTPSCLTLPWRTIRKTAWRQAPPASAHGAAFSACVGHVPGRAGLPGGDVAAGQLPTNKNELIAWTWRMTLPACHADVDDILACSPARQTCPGGRGAPAHHQEDHPPTTSWWWAM